MRRFLPLICVLFSNLACTHTSYTMRDLAPTFIGKHTDQLLLKLGEPNQKPTLKDGREVWIYSAEEGGAGSSVAIAGAHAAVGGWRPIRCKQTYVVKSSIVQSYELDGKGCRLKHQTWQSSPAEKSPASTDQNE